MGWYRDVSDAMYLALCAVFGIDPESSDGLKRFVPAYINNATNAQAPRDMNICYYAISEVRDSIFNYIQTENIVKKSIPNVRIKKTIPVSVLFTFYGENADDDAEFFWERILWDSGYGSPRAVLRGLRIVPLDMPDRPLSLYEVEGTFQRRRCDVRMNFAYLMMSDVESGYVDSTPELNIDGQ